MRDGGHLVLLLHGLVSPFKTQARLEAEIVLLRHQLNVPHQRVPSKPRLTVVDRLLFVWLYLATVKRAGEVPLSAEHDGIECAGSELVEFLVRKPCPSATASAH